MLVAILDVNATLDDEELLSAFECDHGHVPNTFVVIHTLTAVSDKGPKILGFDGFGRRRNDHEKFEMRQGYECLAAERVPFYQVATVRQAGWPLASGNADRRVSAFRIYICQTAETFEAGVVHRRLRIG